MTSKEFVIWFKGFSAASNEYNITPNQWLTIVDALNKVEDETVIKPSDLGVRFYTGTYPSYTTTVSGVVDSSKEKTRLND